MSADPIRPFPSYMCMYVYYIYIYICMYVYIYIYIYYFGPWPAPWPRRQGGAGAQHHNMSATGMNLSPGGGRRRGGKKSCGHAVCCLWACICFSRLKWPPKVFCVVLGSAQKQQTQCLTHCKPKASVRGIRHQRCLRTPTGLQECARRGSH